MHQQVQLFLILLFLSGCAPHPIERLTTPTTPPLKQSLVHPNSCGPCALVNAFSHASSRWRQPTFFQQAPSQQAKAIISEYGKHPSTNQTNRPRWNPAKGVNATDLLCIANEISPTPLSLVNTANKKHKPNRTELRQILNTIHTSLKNGFPPILSVKQQRHKKFRSKEGYYWVETSGHFITLINAKIDATEEKIAIEYIDPFDGKTHTGKLYFSSASFKTTSPLTRKELIWQPNHLQASLPKLSFFNKNSRKNEVVTTEIDSFILFR